MTPESADFPILPQDAHNQALVDLVRPREWRNPTPAARYNLVVIGGGTAGLVAAAGAAGLGAKVALVERHLLGGDCLNVGCVPSKTLLRSARALADIRGSRDLGVRVDGEVEADFTAVMARVRETRASLAVHDSAERFRGLGVDVFLGDARFSDRRTVLVDGTPLRFSRAVVATGARAKIPSIPGLADAAPLTNETVFSLTALPPRLAVIGGGPIGCELAQAFARLGSAVVLFNDRPHVLDREDPEAAAIVEDALTRDGVRLVLDAHLHSVETAERASVIRFEAKGERDSVDADAILVSAGRAPRIEDLGLEAAGIEVDSQNGVVVDDFLRTTNQHVYACGDVSMRWKFTHAADVAARIVIQNALFAVGPFGRRRLSAVNMAWCTYTDPEVAHVGLTDHEAQRLGVACDVYRQPFTSLDRAATDGDTRGFVKVMTKKGTGDIVGATIVAGRAGELISEIAVAMHGKLGLGTLANVIHPYPTYAEAIRKCGDAYNRTRLTPQAIRWLTRWLGWRLKS